MARNQNLNERWEIVGHSWAVKALEQAVSANKGAQSLLLTGPHGIGKTTLARALARRLECTNPNPPCGVCSACQKNLKGISPDLRIVEGVPTGWKLERDGPPLPRKNDRERRTLRIEQIRQLQPWLATAPFEGRLKVALLRRFEEANDEAANAFLKTLEEPPSRVLLILTAQDASLLLSTIVSRCQRLALRPLPIEQVEKALVERWEAPENQARLLARLSGGRLGWAVRALGEASILEKRGQALEALDQLVGEGRAERISRAGELAKDPSELPEVLELWLSWWRDVLLFQSGDGARVINVDKEGLVRTYSQQLSTADVQGALKSTRLAARQLEQNANARLVFQVLALNLPKLQTAH